MRAVCAALSVFFFTFPAANASELKGPALTLVPAIERLRQAAPRPEAEPAAETQDEENVTYIPPKQFFDIVEYSNKTSYASFQVRGGVTDVAKKGAARIEVSISW